MATYAGVYSEHLQDRYGNGYRNALVAVQTLAATPVTLYADRVKTAYVPASGLAANEIKADTKGNLRFFADPGNYQIVVTPSGGSTLAAFPISVLPDPLEPDASEGALAAEQEAREDADAALTQAIADEATARANADTALSTSVAGKVSKADNLSDLVDAEEARGNLGLGDAATQDAMDLPVSTAQGVALALKANLPHTGRNLLTGMFHVDGYGAVLNGDAAGAGTDDTAALNEAISDAYSAGGGTVYVPSKGTKFCVFAGVVMKSRVRLELAPGVTLVRKAGSSGHILTNEAVTPLATDTDGAITSGSAVLTTALAAQAVPGQTVIIGTRMVNPANGAGLGGGLLVADVVSATPTTITLSRTAGTTTTVAAVALFNRDKAIGFDFGVGSKIECRTNGGSGINAHHIRLRRIDGLQSTGVWEINATTGKYAVSVADCRDVEIPSITGVVNSAVIQFDGPNERIKIGLVSGTSTDDTLAFTASNGPAFAAYNDSEGPMVDIDVEEIWSNCATVCFKLTTNATYGTYIDRLRVGKITQRSTTQSAAVAFSNDTGPLDLRNIELGEVYGRIGILGGTIEELKVGRVQLPSNAANSAPGMSFAGTTVKKLLIESAYADQAAKTGAHMILLSGGAVITDLAVQSFYWKVGGGSYGLALGDATNNVNTARFGKGRWVGPSSGGLFQSAFGGTLTRVFGSDLVLDTVGWIGDVGTTTAVYLNNVVSNSGFFLRAAGAVTVRGSGMEVGVGGVAAGGTIRSKSIDFPIDVSLAHLTKAAGDLAYNTNAALACGVGPVVCNGTTWKGIHSGVAA